MRLLKGVYGFETSPKKTPFGLLNEQQRVDYVVKSGGWFNYAGEKIGRGDLSMADFQSIAKGIPVGEAFFVLSEVDSLWDMPAGLDRSEPGMDYILKTAIWMVSASTGIVRLRDNITKGDVADSGGVRYSRIPRSEMITAFGSKPKTTSSTTATKVKSLSEELDAALAIAAKMTGTTKKPIPKSVYSRAAFPYSKAPFPGLPGSIGSTGGLKPQPAKTIP